MTDVWCAWFILPLHQEENCRFQKKSVSEPLLAVVCLKIDMLPQDTLKTYRKKCYGQSLSWWSLLQEPQILRVLVWTLHKQSGASSMCHKQKYMTCLIESAMENLASESKISMWAATLMAAAVSSPPFLPSAPSSWKDMKTVHWGITCWG